MGELCPTEYIHTYRIKYQIGDDPRQTAALGGVRMARNQDFRRGILHASEETRQFFFKRVSVRTRPYERVPALSSSGSEGSSGVRLRCRSQLLTGQPIVPLHSSSAIRITRLFNTETNKQKTCFFVIHSPLAGPLETKLLIIRVPRLRSREPGA